MKSIKNISAPVEYCPECHSLKRKPNRDCGNHDTYWRETRPFNDLPQKEQRKIIRGAMKKSKKLQDEVINSQKPMLKNKPAKKKVVAKKKRRMNHRNVFNYLGHHYNTYER